MTPILQSALVVCAWLVPFAAAATCPPSCPLPGGGQPEFDCHAEFAATALRLNYPPFDPAAPAPGGEVRCFDGDAGCDTDGAVNGVCTFNIDVCLHNADPELPRCTPAPVTSVNVAGSIDPDLAALQSALTALLPATSNVCTSGMTLHVPLTPDELGHFQIGHKSILIAASAEGGAIDLDNLGLACVPRGWPSHGYNHANHRATATETTLSPDNAAQLAPKWQLDLAAVGDPGFKPVTSTPTVGFGFVYVTAWTGRVYAVRPETGEIVWTYTVTPGSIGIQSSATLTADGRLLVGDYAAVLHCLDAVTGRPLWTARDTDPNNADFTSADHHWGSPVVANNRVFVGIASHSDNPCTRGRLLAFDLDTGAHLWTRKTVPDRICSNDTAVECESEADCGGAECVLGRGAGVTASVAVDKTGEAVYMNTVGCYKFPSIGDSDTMFRLDAATGEVVWKTRVQPPEQFGACRNDPATDCRNDADCGGTECRTKLNYHDFGFLNGPLLIDADDGEGGTRPLVVSGSKDGTLYAFDPATGDIVWKNEIVPTPVTPGFAAYGLFNGAVGYANQRIHAALNFTIPPGNPEPKHLMAFSTVDGSPLWDDEIGRSWSHVTLANNLLFAGTEAIVTVCEQDPATSCSEGNPCPSGPCVERGPFYIYDARDGRRLKRILLPQNVVGGATVVDGTVYVPYGGLLDTEGGVVALSLLTCVGDCNRDGSVTIDEVLTGVGIGLGEGTMSACFAFDRNTDSLVTIDELVAGVDHAVGGCS